MKIGIIGLGYVGLPLVIQFAKSGAQVLGIDVDETKANALNDGESYIKHIPAAEVRAQRDAGQIEAATDYARVKELDAVLICVPTPLDDKHEPDYPPQPRTQPIHWPRITGSIRRIRPVSPRHPS